MEFKDYGPRDVANMKATIEILSVELSKAKADREKLAAENSRFRLLLLNSVGEADTIHIANEKTHWEQQPIETLIEFLELFEKHTKVFAELVHLKISKQGLAEHIKDREEKKKAAAEAYREKVGAGMSAEERSVRKAIAQEDKAKEKAIAGLMKQLKISREVAETMLKSMQGR